MQTSLSEHFGNASALGRHETCIERGSVSREVAGKAWEACSEFLVCSVLQIRGVDIAAQRKLAASVRRRLGFYLIVPQ